MFVLVLGTVVAVAVAVAGKFVASLPVAQVGLNLDIRLWGDFSWRSAAPPSCPGSSTICYLHFTGGNPGPFLTSLLFRATLAAKKYTYLVGSCFSWLLLSCRAQLAR